MAATISATDVELQKPVNVVYQQTFLRRAQQLLPYFAGTRPGTLNRQAGTSTIKWRRIEQETPTTAALAELTGVSTYMQGRDADTPTFTDIVATVAKYGQFYIVNEEVDLFLPSETTNELVAVLGESAGRSLNMLMRNVAEDNLTQRYTENSSVITAVHTPVIAADLDRIVNELARNSARPFSPMSSGSQNVGSTPILRSYWGIVHPDVAHDLAGLTGFQSVEKYAGQVAIADGEIGYYSRVGRGIRFIQSEDASIDANSGATISGEDVRTTSGIADIYTIVIYGEDAMGSVGLGQRHTDGIYRAGENKGAFEMIFHERGSGGVSDPFNEIATLAWKAWFAGAVLNANWGFALRVGATNLSN